MAESIIEKLTQSFLRFPGIGPRQAKRFVYYLLRSDPVGLEVLIEQIRELKKNLGQCQTCRRFFSKNGGANPLCPICADPARDQTLLMLVEKDIDLENVERSGTFSGHYFILGGLILVLDKNPEQQMRIKELLNRLASQPKIKEVIIAVAASLEGDQTIEFLKKCLAPLAAKNGFKISALGRGLSTGTELEYSDPETLKNALKHRE